jgi:hypothetical protein
MQAHLIANALLTSSLNVAELPEQASLKSGISESAAAEAVATEIERARRHSNKVLRKEVELKELR